MSTFGTKYTNIPYLGPFGLEFEKGLVISETSTLKFLKNESLMSLKYESSQNENFGMGSGFSEDLGPYPGPLYEICPQEQKIYRGYKAINKNSFNNDLKTKLDLIKILDYSSFEDVLINVLNNHAPVKGHASYKS